MRKWRSPWPVICAAAALVSCAPAAGQKEDAKEPTGIAVGEKAPDFKLKDQEGQERSLKELLGERDEALPQEKKDEEVVALVFFRSADW